jgi:hypothetical protein
MLESRVEAGLPNFFQPVTGETSKERDDNVGGMNGNHFNYFDFPSAAEELPVCPRNEHGTSSDDFVQDESPLSQLAEPHQFPRSSSPISPQYLVPRFNGVFTGGLSGPRELEAIETIPVMPGTPRIECQESDERKVFADLLI